MQRVRKKKSKIGAVLLSIALVFSMIVIPSVKKTRDVYAYGEPTGNFKKWAMAQTITGSLGNTYFNPDQNESPDIETAINYEALKEEKSVTLQFEEFYGVIESDFAKGVFTEQQIEDTLKKMNSSLISYDETYHQVKIDPHEVTSSDTCNLIGQAEDEDSGNIIMYGVWSNNDTSEKGDYVALELDDNYSIVKYRKVNEADISVGFDAYTYDYETDEVTDYMTTKDGKSVAVVPFGTTAKCREAINIEGKNVDADLEMELSKDSSEKVITLEKNGDRYQISANNEPVNNNPESIICEYKDDNGMVVVKGTVPCYVLKMSIKDMFSGYGINVEPSETITLKARTKGYQTEGLTYKWESKEFSDIDGKTTESIQFNAPTETKTGSIKLSVYTNEGELLATDSEDVTVGKCSISFSVMDSKTGETYSENANLQANQSYILGMKGADFGWAVNNSDNEFEKWTFTQNGKTLTLGYDDKLTGDKSFVDINGDVGGSSIPHEIVVFKKAGKVTVTGTIKRNGEEFKSGSTIFNIGKASQTITASNVTKTYATKNQSVYLNAKVKDKAALSYKSDNKNITVDSKGKVTIKAKYVGAANITITSKETANYNAGKKVVKVTVNPSKTTLSSVKNTKSKTMSVTWKKNTVGSGYQIEYAMNSKFSGKKAVNISKNKTTSYTVSKLTKKKTYYVRIRTYKKVSGKTYYSGWSSVKKVKITK